jgi:hypothetical protein
VDSLNHVVGVCVLNQSIGHLLLSDVLNFTITMSSKANEEVNVRPSFEPLMDDGSRISFELPSLAYNIR